MNRSFIKSSLVILFAIVFSYNSIAQQNHFIYLQTDNKQPFYVKLNKKVISSSASGYVIIPKLLDGDIALTIGFPKNEWPEQSINCTINKKDAGYVLKNFGDKGWGLFNLQTLQVVMSGTKAKDIAVSADTNKKDDFSNTLSNVVKDPSIAKKDEEIKVDTVAAVVTEVKQPVVPQPEVKQQEIKQPATTVAEVKQEVPVIKLATAISKLLNSNNADGTDIIYVDMVEGKSDTVRIFIPAEKESLQKTEKVSEPKVEPKAEPKIETKEEPKVTAVKAEPKAEIVPEIKKEEAKPEPKPEIKAAEPKVDTIAVVKTEVKKEDPADKTPKFIDITLPNPNAKTDSATAKQEPPVPVVEKKVEVVAPAPEKPKESTVKPVMLNSDCKATAGEDDFLKLRKKMAAENNDDDMVTIAKKAFKSKCYTTEQVKNLSVLFLKDEGKYKFFDAAYPFVTDAYNFASLETQLTDSYFITRFKVMLRH